MTINEVKMKLKENKYIIFIVIILLLTTSFIKFNTLNFIKSGYGLTKIISNREEIVMVKSSPKIYISNPNHSMVLLKDMMRVNGFDYLPDERNSSTLVFHNGSEKIYVEFSLNKYYGLWKLVKD